MRVAASHAERNREVGSPGTPRRQGLLAAGAALAGLALPWVPAGVAASAASGSSIYDSNLSTAMFDEEVPLSKYRGQVGIHPWEGAGRLWEEGGQDGGGRIKL